MADRIYLITTFAFASFFTLALTTLTFYNLECTSYDKSFVEFEYCYIKAISRSLKNISLKANILKPPLTNISIELALSYRANGWKPFLYNITFDGCKFLDGKQKNPFVAHVYKSIKTFSNLNHTCPFNHDIMLSNFSSAFTEYLWTKMLPTPEGQYRVSAIWSVNLIRRVQVNIYAKIS